MSVFGRHVWGIPLLAISLSSCAPSSSVAKDAARQSDGFDRTDDERVLEAAYRWFIADQEHRGCPSRAYFLSSVAGDDPSVALIVRFSGLQPIVKKASASEVEDSCVRDRETHAPGYLLKVHRLRRNPDGSVELEVDGYTGPLGAEGATLILIPDGPEWMVREIRDRWIS